MGVADDRQQRVERERDERRHYTDAPGQRNEEREQGERRNRLHDTGRAEDQPLRRRTLRGEYAERNADDDARGERQEHEAEVLDRQAAEVRGEKLLRETASRWPNLARRRAFGYCRESLPDESCGDRREVLAFQLRSGIHSPHR